MSRDSIVSRFMFLTISAALVSGCIVIKAEPPPIASVQTPVMVEQPPGNTSRHSTVSSESGADDDMPCSGICEVVATGTPIPHAHRRVSHIVRESLYEPVNPVPAEILDDQIQTYLTTLKGAAYAFNLPQSVTVEKASRIYFVLDLHKDQASAARDLHGLTEDQINIIEQGVTKWATEMSVHLSGPADEVTVQACAPEAQTIAEIDNNPKQWCWDVTPKRPGEVKLDLELDASIPGSEAKPEQIAVFHRTLSAERTAIWTFNHDFDSISRYLDWKWALGGLAGFLATLYSRRAKKNGASAVAKQRPRTRGRSGSLQHRNS